MTILCIDFETADYKPDSACALALVKITDGKISAEHSILIRPPRKRIIFTDIHNLAWNDLKGQLRFHQHWPDIEQLFHGIDYIAAHNAGFDRSVLFSSLEATGITPPEGKFLCTVKLARLVWNIYPTKLNLVCDQLKIPLNHHEALSDARACAQIILAAKRDTVNFESVISHSLIY